MRIESAIRNAKSTLLVYGINMLLQFCIRLTFLYYLTIEYVGLNGLFDNILSVLSLTELGIGPAIVCTLYGPLARNDIKAVQSIMKVFKRAYIIIGVLIIAIGFSISPWLYNFIKSPPNIPDLTWFYLFFVIDTGISYFYSYNRNLLIADQKQYIINNVRGLVQVVGGILQVVSLVLFQSFWSYILIRIGMTLTENIIVTRRTQRIYPYITESGIEPLAPEIKGQIIGNVKALVLHKIGGIAVFSSANIILSKFVGLTAVGFFSNYYLLINAVMRLSDQVFNSLKASVGNLNALADNDRKLDVFHQLFFITGTLAYIISLNMYFFINPFIELWLGKAYLLSNTIVLLMATNFYLTYMRKSALVFIDSMGLFIHNKFMPICEATLIISSGIFLVQRYEIIGILLAMILTTLCMPFIVEPYILFKHGLRGSIVTYYVTYLKYGILLIAVGSLIQYGLMQFDISNNVVTLAIRLIIINIIAIGIWCAVWWRNTYFRSFREKIMKKLFKL